MPSQNLRKHDPTYIIGSQLSKTFQIGDQWVQALDRVSITVPRGQFVAVMGPSGSGKSTLLYVLTGLDRPSAGEIIINGRPIDQMNSEELARYRREMVGFVFQQFHLVPTLTALENAALPGVFTGMPRLEREQRAAKLLTFLEMGERLNNRPNQLSGGQQQRVAIARALFNNPPILVADEPTGALDSKTGTIVMTFLRQLCNRYSKTIIVVTHDEGVARYADRVVHLMDGRIVTDQVGESATAPQTHSKIKRTTAEIAAAVDLELREQDAFEQPIQESIHDAS